MIYIVIIFTVILALYCLWVLYLAVMNLKRVRDLGKLSNTAKVLGTPILVLGYLIDFLLNAVLMSILLLELPRELTISERLKRHNTSSHGWKKSVSTWFEPLLDPFDPSGNHI